LKKFLIIQTASIGDVILTTPVIERLHNAHPNSVLDILVKKGNEQLFDGHPFLGQVITWDKKKRKYSGLLNILKTVRREKYDVLVNMQRFTSTGFITLFSRAKYKTGFDKNPFSRFFDLRVPHRIGEDSLLHEAERNLELIREITVDDASGIKLYPQKEHFSKVMGFKKSRYICIAPASLWFTKQFPEEKWIEFINTLEDNISIYSLGSAEDRNLCDRIVRKVKSNNVKNLAGDLNLLETAALMQDAVMNFVNDSAPQHLASAVNAPLTAIFCSTIPDFGFGPRSDDSVIIETEETLSCRPCGLHGLRKCPEDHFRCAHTIDVNRLKSRIV